MKRSLIEFYSQRTPENLISLLKEPFDCVSFLYFKKKNPPSDKIRSQIQKVVLDILGCTPEFVPLQEESVEEALSTISSLVLNDGHYVFDITGGNELFIAAAGIFIAQNPSLSLRLQQYDVYTGKPIAIYPPEKSPPTTAYHAQLKTEQVFALGGSPPLVAPRHHFSYGTLPGEIHRLWKAVKDHLKEWNDFFSFSSEEDKDSMTQKKMCSDPAKQNAYRVISRALKTAGILKNEREVKKVGATYMEFDLNVPQEALILYEKGGNLLEMYMALAAHQAGLFHDIRVGVILDWDGVITQRKQEPRNEIDVVLLKENLPILASCKNTNPKKDFLYEIMIMAKHYGGYYATPALFSAFAATATVRQRAVEMGVVLIDNIYKKSFEQLTRELRNRFS